MEAVVAIRGPDEFCGPIKYNGKLEVQKALLNFVLNERPHIEPLEITGKAAALLPRQMMRVVAERGARSVPLDYLRDFCNENIHLLQIKESSRGLRRSSLLSTPSADRGARSV
jgi:hypothetical protein